MNRLSQPESAVFKLWMPYLQRIFFFFFFFFSVYLDMPSKSAVRFTERLDMTIVVDWDAKPQNKQTKKNK